MSSHPGPSRAVRRAAARTERRAARDRAVRASAVREVRATTAGRWRGVGYGLVALWWTLVGLALVALTLALPALAVLSYPAGENLDGLRDVVADGLTPAAVGVVLLLVLATAVLGAALLVLHCALWGAVGLSVLAARRAFDPRYDGEALTFSVREGMQLAHPFGPLPLVPARRTPRSDSWVRCYLLGCQWRLPTVRAGAVLGVVVLGAPALLAWPLPGGAAAVVMVLGLAGVLVAGRDLVRGAEKADVAGLYRPDEGP